MNMPFVIDERTGVAIVRPVSGMLRFSLRGIGHITYRCHSCGELIPKPWEVFFFDPADGWAGYIAPAVMPRTMTTHHDWHMAATQED